MDKNQADAASEALMAQAKAEQSRRTGRIRARPAGTAWRVVGSGLMGCGVGLAIGAGAGQGVLFGAVGFVFGMALAALAGRRQD